MTLQSLSYFVALAVLWLLALPLRNPRRRQLLLLAASYLFYATWGLSFLALLVASSLMNYAWGRVLRRRLTPGMSVDGIALNALLLGFFKYLPPLAPALTAAPDLGHMLRSIVMPVGVSFGRFKPSATCSIFTAKKNLIRR